MKKNALGRTGQDVTALCLGTMTFGTQTTLEEGHAQLDAALDAGINFVDTAEMYPVNPVKAKTIGRTERIVGQWFVDKKRRDDVILATKHSGEGLKFVRDGARISGQTIHEAIDGSLRRLKTEYIDLYQFHWPNRGSYMFRKNWHYDPTEQDHGETMEEMQEAMEALHEEVQRGRIRYFGLSNETAWGLCQWSRLADEGVGPRPVSVQNEYSMMCRLFDTDLAETVAHEQIGLLAYSPLATGLLSGKYQGDKVPDHSRMSLNRDLGGRATKRAFKAVEAYLDIAQRHGLDPIHMALAWCMQRPFMTSVIFGATTMEQLQHIIAGKDVVLSEEVMHEIDRTHKLHPMPF